MTTLFFDSKKGSGRSENFKVDFNPPLEMNIHDTYEMALISAEIWYSWHNITNENNTFVYAANNEARKVRIPPGAYNIANINDTIHDFMRQNGDNEEGITITPNYNTLKSKLELKLDYAVDFRVSSIRSVLGFGNILARGNRIHESENIVNITNINTVQIHCNLIEGSYINGSSSDLLYTFSPNVSPGFLIQLSPSQKMYVPLKRIDLIDNIRISLKDQDGNFINLNNERTTYFIHLRKIM